jgi:hypothetical protein
MRSIAGTWALVEAKARTPDGQPSPPPFGGQGHGRLWLGPDGRTMAVLCDARPSLPPGTDREYSSYYGNTLVTRVDAASDPARLGTDQVRQVRFEGELLVLKPPVRTWQGKPQQRELWWRRIADM